MNQQQFHTSATVFEKNLQERPQFEGEHEAPRRKTARFSLGKFLKALLGRTSKREVPAPRKPLGAAGKLSKLK
ncbi:MAG: hypothetical protein IT310_06655 [Anaerolineales bacterium]|nr:hypothetical protein [Anaerolineales bacterium]